MGNDGKVRIWMRLGVELKASRDEAEKLLQGCEKTLANMINASINFTPDSKIEIVGDTYIPCEVLEQLSDGGEDDLAKNSVAFHEMYESKHIGFGKHTTVFSHNYFSTVEFGFFDLSK